VWRSAGLATPGELRWPAAGGRLIVQIVAEATTWHAIERVRELAPFLVVPRAGHVDDVDAAALPAVSSTEVRRRVREGLSTEGLVDPEVAAYARAHALYR